MSLEEEGKGARRGLCKTLEGFGTGLVINCVGIATLVRMQSLNKHKIHHTHSVQFSKSRYVPKARERNRVQQQDDAKVGRVPLSAPLCCIGEKERETDSGNSISSCCVRQPFDARKYFERVRAT